MSSRWIEGCSRGLGCPLRRSIRLAHVCSPTSKTQLSLFFSFSARPPITFFADRRLFLNCNLRGAALRLCQLGIKIAGPSVSVCFHPINPQFFPQCCCSIYLFDSDFHASMHWRGRWWETCVVFILCTVMSEAAMAYWLCLCARRNSDSEMNGKAGGRGPSNKASETNSNANNVSMVSEMTSDPQNHTRVSI